MSAFRPDFDVPASASILKSLPGLRCHGAVNRTNLVTPLLLMLCIGLTGCMEMNLMTPVIQSMKFKSTARDEERDAFEDDFDLEGPEEVRPPFIGDYVVVSGLNLVVLEGVGLVTGLDGTGGDPPPSQYRTQLLQDMRRREVEEPNRIISSPSTALVIVRAYLPPLVEPGEKFDVEVRVPEGSTTTSLNGGWLLECSLTERAIVAGRGVLEGKERARAQGPILVSTGENESNSLLRRGRIVGGGVGLETRDMTLLTKNDYRSVRNTTRIAAKIGERFFSYDRYGHREPLSKAKTDQKIELRIHPTYKDNFPRYIQVIQAIAFRETDVEKQVRVERLEKELLIPEKAERATLELEALGPEAIPSLKKGLEAKYLECRFYSAVALAYLGEPAGLETLYQAARDEPAFRVFALAAMTGVEGGETFVYLRQLMDEPIMETRYGAFRCMTTIDDNEPFVKGELLNEQCRLHPLDVAGEPMIHLTHRQKAEIVLFGSEQEFRTPMALNAGPHIMVNCPTGSDEVVVSRYRVGQKDQRKVVSRKIADVIRAAAEMGASYPDLAQMLVQAERQKNLPGKIGIDMLPEAGRYYERPDSPDGTTTKKKKTRVGRSSMAPNPFTKGTADEDAVSTKPLMTEELLQDGSQPADVGEETEMQNEVEPVDEPSAESTEAPPAQTAELPKEDAPPQENEGFSPLKKLKQMMKHERNGEMLYPEIEEEE